MTPKTPETAKSDPQILEILLDIDLPTDSIGVVMMQPFIELNINREPFAWQPAKKHLQIDSIRQTLVLAQSRPAHQHVSFTVFPEYSVPGLDGVAAIQEILLSDSWPVGTIVIAGIDGLDKSHYLQLCGGGGVETFIHDGNKPERLPANGWVNSCITWVKSPSKGLVRWVQLKLAPAQLENNVIAKRMYKGQGVYVFNAKFQNDTECRFMTLICYDWIDKNKGLWKVLSRYDAQSTTTREIHTFFVIQYNPKPNDNLFLEYARRYFEDPETCPRLNRAAGCLVFANTAGRADVGLSDHFGFSSLIFSPGLSFDRQGCPPTFAINSTKLRKAVNLERCPEALLRENGACIHSFGLRPPRWIGPNVGDRSHPIENALVHPLAAGIDEPRTPSTTVPAIVKWFSDYLTAVGSLLKNESTHPLKRVIDDSLREIVEQTRKLTDSKLAESINLLSVKISQQESERSSRDKWVNVWQRRVHNIDNWDADDVKCLEHLVFALAVLKTAFQIEIAKSPAHATVRLGNEIYDVAVVCGPSHDECEKNVRSRFDRIPSRHALVITTDARGFRRRVGKAQIDDTGDSKPDITDPTSAWHFCDYNDLISTVSGASDVASLARNVGEVLAL